jgi:hypothetical protein
MRPGECVDNLGQGSEMEVEQTADCVVMVKPIALGGEGAIAGGTLELFDARN